MAIKPPETKSKKHLQEYQNQKLSSAKPVSTYTGTSAAPGYRAVLHRDKREQEEEERRSRLEAWDRFGKEIASGARSSIVFNTAPSSTVDKIMDGIAYINGVKQYKPNTPTVDIGGGTRFYDQKPETDNELPANTSGRINPENIVAGPVSYRQNHPSTGGKAKPEVTSLPMPVGNPGEKPMRTWSDDDPNRPAVLLKKDQYLDAYLGKMQELHKNAYEAANPGYNKGKGKKLTSGEWYKNYEDVEKYSRMGLYDDLGNNPELYSYPYLKDTYIPMLDKRIGEVSSQIEEGKEKYAHVEETRNFINKFMVGTLFKLPDDYEENRTVYNGIAYDAKHGYGSYYDMVSTGKQEEADAEGSEIWSMAVRNSKEDYDALASDFEKTATSKSEMEGLQIQYDDMVASRKAADDRITKWGWIKNYEDNLADESRPIEKYRKYGSAAGNPYAELYATIAFGGERERYFIGFTDYNDEFMSDDMRKTYVRIYEQYGENAAIQYLQALNDMYLRERSRKLESDSVDQLVDEIPWFMFPVRTVMRPVGAISTGIGMLTGADKDSGLYDMTRQAGLIDARFGEKAGDLLPQEFLGTKLGTFLYSTAASVVDNIVAGKTGSIFGSAGKVANTAAEAKKISNRVKRTIQFLMSAEATASAFVDDIENGMDFETAVIHSVCDGLIEAATEKWSIEAIFSDKTLLGRYLLKGIVSEGSEEVVGNIATLITDKFIYGKDSIELKAEELYKQYNGSVTYDAAYRMAAKSWLEELAVAGLSGAAAGGFSTGIEAATGFITGENASEARRNKIAANNIGSSVSKSGQINTVIEAAKGITNRTPGLTKALNKAEAEIAKKGHVSTRTAARTVQEIVATDNEFAANAARTAMENDVAERIMSMVPEGTNYNPDVIRNAAKYIVEVSTNTKGRKLNVTPEMEDAFKQVKEANAVMLELKYKPDVQEEVAKKGAEAANSNENPSVKAWEAIQYAQEASAFQEGETGGAHDASIRSAAVRFKNTPVRTNDDTNLKNSQPKYKGGVVKNINGVGQNATVKVALNDGTTTEMKLDDVEFGSNASKDVYNTIAKNARNVAEARQMLTGYEEAHLTPRTFFRGWDAVVEAAHNGTDVEAEAAAAANQLKEASPAAYQLAQDMGLGILMDETTEIGMDEDSVRNITNIIDNMPVDADASYKGAVLKVQNPRQLSVSQRMQVSVIDYVAKMNGSHVVITDDASMVGQGVYKGGNQIVINLNSEEGVLTQVFGHETWHQLKAWSKNSTTAETGNLATDVESIENFVLAKLGENPDFDLETRIAEVQDQWKRATGKELDRDAAIEEIMANSIGAVFANQVNVEEAIDSLGTGFGEKLKSIVKRFMGTIRKALDRIAGKSIETASVLKQDYDTLQKIYDMTNAALAKRTGVEWSGVQEWTKNDARYTEEGNGDASSYSIKITDSEKLDELDEAVKSGKVYTTYKSMSFWGYDADGNAILRSPMAEIVDGKLTDAYLIPKDKSKLNWYQATEDPSQLLVKYRKPGNKSDSYVLASERPDLVAEDWSNLYFKLQRKDADTGKKQDVYARYNPYEHSSDVVLNDQFKGAYNRSNLVTVKMLVPMSEDNGTYRAQYSKDATGWTEWKSGDVAAKIQAQKDFRRNVFLSRYAAPVEIVSDAEVAQKYKEYLSGTDIAVPDNVVSPSLRKELEKAGVPIERSGKVKYSIKANDSNYMQAVENGDTETAQRMLDEAAKEAFPDSKLIQDGVFHKMWHHTNKEFTEFLPGTSASSGGLKGIYFTPQQNSTMSNLGDKNGAYYLNVKNMKFALGVDADRQYVNELKTRQEGITDRQELARINREFSDETGIDAFFDWQNGWYNVLKPELIKSADPVTYDDNGNVIPLSERFNAENKDIRYSLKDSDGNDLTDEQAEYFADSKVRDASGKLMKMYHGTGADFTVFDKSFIGSTGRFEGAGFNFTPSRERAASYSNGKNVMEGYLNIKNPLSSERKTLSVSKLAQIIREADPTGDNIIANYARETRDYGADSFIRRESMTAARSIWDASENDVDIYSDISTADPDSVSLIDKFKSLGYDGLIHYNDDGNIKTAVAFDSSQFKNADNVSPTDNEDVRYSIKNTGTINDEVLDLVRENDQLAVEVERLRSAMSGRVEVRPGDARKMASYIKNEWGSKVDYNTLVGQLTSVFNVLANAKTPADTNAGLQTLGEIAKIALENSEITDRTAYDQYKEFRDALRKGRWILSETQWAEGEAIYGSRQAFRRAMMGRINLVNANGQSLEGSSWDELCDMYPGLNRDASEGDKVSEIISALDNTNPVVTRNPYGNTLEESAQQLALELYDRFVHDVGIRKADEIHDQSQVVGDLEAKNRQLGYQNDSLRVQLDEALKGWDEAKRKAIINVESQTAQRQVGVAAKRLAQKLLSETDLKHIPEGYKDAIKMTLKNILMQDRDGMTLVWDKKSALKMLQKLSSIKAMETINDEEMNDALFALSNNIEFYNEQSNATSAADLARRRDALYAIRENISAITGIVNSENNLFLDGKRVNVENGAFEVSRGIGDRKKKEYMNAATNGLIRSIKYGNTIPEYFFKGLKNEGLSRLYKQVQNGENRYGLLLAKSKSALEGFAKDYHYASWDVSTPVEFTTEHGEKVALTVEQAMSLYATWKREHIGNDPDQSSHLEDGGFVLKQNRDSKNPLKKGYIDNTSHRITEADMETVKQKILTKEQMDFVDAVVEYMTKDIGAIGNQASMERYGIYKYTEPYYFPIRSWEGNLNKSVDSAVQNKVGAPSRSFNKRRIARANNAVMIENFTDVVSGHINEMLTGSCFDVALENFRKVLNYREVRLSGDDGKEEVLGKSSIEAKIKQAYGENAQKYMNQFLYDLKGGVNDYQRTGYDFLLSGFKKNAVAGSASVALQQPLSYIRAAMMISPKYLAQALSPEYWNGSRKEMLEHSGVAVIKDMGRFDMGYGQSARQYLTPDVQQGGKLKQAGAKISEYSTILPEKMDQMTWTRMWSACKIEQHNLHPDMDIKSDEFLDIVAERFNDLMRKTQVYDSVLVRSENMRSNNPVMKAITSFMAEPTLSLNVLYDALSNVNEAGGKVFAAKAAATYLLSAILQAAVKAQFGAGRSPDDKETEGENILTRFVYNFISEVNPLGLIPGYGNIIDALSGSDVSDNAWGYLKTISNMFTDGLKWISGKSEKTLWRNIEDTAGMVFQIFSPVPVKNLMRDTRAMWNLFVHPEGTYANRDFSWNVVGLKALETLTGEDMVGMINKKLIDAGMGFETKNDAYYQRIYHAQKNGNQARADSITDYMMNYKLAKNNDPEKALKSGVAKAAKADESLTAEEKADFLYGGGYTTGTNYIAEQYRAGELDRETAEKLYRQQKPDATDDDVYWYFDRLDWEIANPDGEDYTKYHTLQDAMDSGKSADITEQVKYMMKHGATKTTITNFITSRYKQAYLEANQTERVRIRNAIEIARKAAGYTKDQNDDYIKGWLKKDK